MTVVLYEGGAGTGKSTSLISSARTWLALNPLGEGQRVLALTKFHGSRKRMEVKLAGPSGLGCPVACSTIDGFAWRLVKRWRSLVRHIGATYVEGDFAAITIAAQQLLQQEAVARWVARTHPLIVVDEFQDCRAGEEHILSALERHVHCLCAADEFQDLSGSSSNPAVEWAKSAGICTTLKENHRTRASGLLAAASALRSDRPLVSDKGNGFEVIGAKAAPLGGSIVSWRIKSWRSLGSLAVITPTGPGTSPFVRRLLEWVNSKQAKTKKSDSTAGPYSVAWESQDSQDEQTLLGALALPADVGDVSSLWLADVAYQVGAPDLSSWCRQQHFVQGHTHVTICDVESAVKGIVRNRRAFGRDGGRARLATTVHQAKNREFDSVIVLWPLRVKKDREQQRRLLYNAITRSRHRALVIVEDPEGVRLEAFPFA